MKTIKWLLLFSLICSFSLFAQDNTNTKSTTGSNVSKQTQTNDWTTIRRNIEDMHKQFEKAMINNDENAMMNLYTDDAIVMPSYSKMVKGKNEIGDMDKKDAQMGTKYKTFNINGTDFFGDGKYAYDIGTYTIDFSNNKMRDIKDHGKYLTIWERQNDGTWKIKAETWNSDEFPTQSMMSQRERTTHEKAGVKTNKDRDKDTDQKESDESGTEKK